MDFELCHFSPPTRAFSSSEDYFAYLNLLDQQLSILIRCTNQAFEGFIKTARCASSLADLVSTFVYFYDGLDLKGGPEMEDWMLHYAQDLISELKRKLLLAMFKSAHIIPAFFAQIGSLEHVLYLCKVFGWKSHTKQLDKIISCIEKARPFKRNLAKIIRQSTLDGPCKLEWVELVAFLCHEHLVLSQFVLLVKYYDRHPEASMERLIGYVETVLNEEDRQVLHTFLFGCQNFSHLSKRLEKIKLSADEAKDEFKEVLDDKQYINVIKESILEAEYDDEPDDTHPEGDQSTKPKTEEQLLEEDLLRAYIKCPAAFDRNSAVRQSADRKQLCQKLKLSHEQIEGWAIMLSRNPKKEALLRDHSLMNYKSM